MMPSTCEDSPPSFLLPSSLPYHHLHFAWQARAAHPRDLHGRRQFHGAAQPRSGQTKPTTKTQASVPGGRRRPPPSLPSPPSGSARRYVTRPAAPLTRGRVPLAPRSLAPLPACPTLAGRRAASYQPEGERHFLRRPGGPGLGRPPLHPLLRQPEHVRARSSARARAGRQGGEGVRGKAGRLCGEPSAEKRGSSGLVLRGTLDMSAGAARSPSTFTSRRPPPVSPAR